jgi:4-amino-4-deoxy-L-arabinose transferase-like glycosyltransferase
MRARVWQVLALATIAATAAATIPLRSLWEPDETNYAEAAREMIASGDWLVPHLNGDAYPHKPPLYLWAVASLRELGLPWTAAGVLPATVSALLLLLLMPALAAAVGVRGSTWGLACGVLASSPLVAGMAACGRMDMLLTLLMALAFLFAARLLGVAGQQDSSQLPHLGLWLAIGLGVLTKGPVAIALPVLSAVVYWTLARPRPALRRLFVGWGPLAAGCIILAWLVPAGLQAGWSFLYDVVVHQSAGRIAASFAHQQPLYYHLIRYPLSGLPWCFVVALGAYHALRGRRAGGPLFLAATVVTTLVFFSLVSGKLFIYLLPMFPAAALLAADTLWRELRGTWPALATGAVLFAALGATLAVADLWRPELGSVSAGAVAMLSGVCALALLAIVRLATGRPQSAIVTLAAAGMLGPVLALPLFVRSAQDHMSVVREAAAIRAAEPGETTGLSFRADFAGFSLYSGRLFHNIVNIDELLTALRAGRVVVMYQRDMNWLSKQLAPLLGDAQIFPFRRHAFVVLRGSPRRPRASP